MLAVRSLRFALGILFVAANLCRGQGVESPPASAPDILYQEPAPPVADSTPAVAENLWPYRPPPGWFASVEAVLTHPRITEFNLFPEGGDPSIDLNHTLAPRVTLGYSLAQGNAFLASYRFLGSEVTQRNPLDLGSYDYLVHAGVDSHWLDLDYRGALHGPACGFTIQWQTGVRLASIDFYRSYTTTDTFLGAGPHFGIDLSVYLARTGVGLFGRGDIGVLFGGGQKEADTVSAGFLGVLDGRGEVGLSWSLPIQRWVRVEGGYLAQGFTLSGHGFGFGGPFVRCEIGF
jgi:hypothetical protein